MTKSQNMSMFFFAQMLVVSLLFGCASTPGREKPLYPVMGMAVSPVGNFITVSTNAQEVAYFDLSPLLFRSLLTPEGSEKPTLSGIFHSPPLAFSPDGRLLIAANVGGKIVGWDVESGAQKFSSPVESEVVDIAVFPDSRAFITAGPGVAMWSSDTGSLIGTFELPTGMKATSTCVSMDGQAVFVGLSSGDIAVYNPVNRELIRTWKGHKVSVTGLAFPPDGKTLASSAGLYDPRLWKLDTELRPAEPATSIDLSTGAAQENRGTQAVTLLVWLLGTARGFHLVGAPTLGAAPVFPDAAKEEPTHCGTRVVFSPDGRYLAATANLRMLSGDNQVLLTDLKSKQTWPLTGIYGCSVSFTAVVNTNTV
jgi:WD40 repeat protein